MSLVRLARRVWVFVASLCLLACSKTEIPNDFRLELAGVVVSTDPVTVLVHTFAADGVRSVGRGEYAFNVQPPALARIDNRGTLVCLKSGDGQVSLTLGPNSRSAVLKCRLVERVETADTGRVDINDGPFQPKIRVIGKGGETLDSVDLLLSTRNTGVLFPRGNLLVPQMVGDATVVARAGQVASEFQVNIVRKVTPEALPLEQNRKIFFSLEPGKYELQIHLPTEKRVTTEWREAPYCNRAATARDHVFVCLLRTKGGVVFDNPKTLIDGSTEISTEGVSIYEIP